MGEVAPSETDLAVMRRAMKERRLLLTEDKDFGDLVFRHRVQAPGIVLLRIDSQKHALKARRLDAAIMRFGESLFGRYTTIEETRFRSRPLWR